MNTGFNSTFTKQVNKWKSLLIASLITIMLSGCTTLLVAGAVITTVDVLHDRRTVGEYIDDGAIELTAKNIVISNPEYRKSSHLKPISWNGILLVSGEVTDETIKQEIIEKYTNIQGVRQVVDETEITDRSKFLTRTNDSWITSQVKSRLVLKTGLKANRVKVTTTRGSVFLMGIVTKEEAEKATSVAQVVRGVKRVVKVFEYQEPSSKN